MPDAPLRIAAVSLHTSPLAQPGRGDAEVGEGAAQRDDHEVTVVRRHLVGALPRDRDGQVTVGFGVHGLDGDVVVEPQREAEGVEAGAEVGAGRRDGHSGLQADGQDERGVRGG